MSDHTLAALDDAIRAHAAGAGSAEQSSGGATEGSGAADAAQGHQHVHDWYETTR